MMHGENDQSGPNQFYLKLMLIFESLQEPCFLIHQAMGSTLSLARLLSDLLYLARLNLAWLKHSKMETLAVEHPEHRSAVPRRSAPKRPAQYALLGAPDVDHAALR